MVARIVGKMAMIPILNVFWCCLLWSNEDSLGEAKGFPKALV